MDEADNRKSMKLQAQHERLLTTCEMKMISFTREGENFLVIMRFRN